MSYQNEVQVARPADAYLPAGQYQNGAGQGQDESGIVSSPSLRRKPLPGQQRPSIVFEGQPHAEYSPRANPGEESTTGRFSMQSGYSFTPSLPNHSRDVSREVESPEQDRLRDSGTAVPPTQTIPFHLRQVKSNPGYVRQSQYAELGSVEGPAEGGADEYGYQDSSELPTPEEAPQLQYFHKPFNESTNSFKQEQQQSRVKSTSSDAQSQASSGSRSASWQQALTPELQIPRSTLPRPSSAYTLGSELNARGRTHSPHLSVGGSPNGSPINHARAHSTNRRSPDNRPVSYIDLLNTPYAQQSASASNLGNNAALKNVVGANASLLDTKKTLEMYRANVKKTNDLSVQYEFALFLVQVAQNALAGEMGADASLNSAELLKEARTILQRLADKSYPFAQYYLADGYASGLFNKGKEDYDRAFPLFIAASKHSHAEAGYRTALCYEFGWGCRKDYAKAVQYYRASASKNHPGAATRLGKACLTGDMGLANRYREGIKWLKRAAESADFQYNTAPYELAILHENGYGPDVFKDEAYAAQLFTKAADLGHAGASLRMGEAYEHGLLCCPKDPALSVHFYNGAAQAGIPEAMMNLCAWYLVGAPPVLEKDEAEAYEWAKKAAEQGLPKAEYALGYFTEMGIGCRRDPLEANVWYVKAADRGDERAKQRLAIIRAAASGDPGIPNAARDGKKKGNKDDKDCIVM